MALWSDPLDGLIADLDRAVSAIDDRAACSDAATMQADYIHLCEFVQALLSRPRDPERLRRVEADPHVQRALANLRASIC